MSKSVATTTAGEYISAEQVCEMAPGVTKGNLAQRRFKGLPPKYLSPTPRVILYRKDDVIAWIEGSARTSTAEVASD